MLLFSLFMVYGCREESIAIENQNVKSKISYKKFSDLPFLQKTVENAEKEFGRVNTTPNIGGAQIEAIAPSELAVDQEASVVEMTLEDGGTMYSLLLDSNSYNLQTGYKVENLNVIVNSDNTESYYLTTYSPTDGQPFYNISDFIGTVTYTDLGGNILSSSTLIGGGDQTEYYIPIEIGCWAYAIWIKDDGTAVIHSKEYICGTGGGSTSGGSTGSSGGSTGGSGDGGSTSGGYTGDGGSGGGTSGTTPTVSAMPNIPTDDYIEQKKYTYFLNNTITSQQKAFLVNNEEINNNIFYYLRDNFFSSASASFSKWGIGFFMQNTDANGVSTVSWAQFQKWFIDGYNAQYHNNLTKLTSTQLQEFVKINKEIDASPYQEEFVKETNEAFVAFQILGDIELLTATQIKAVLVLLYPQVNIGIENIKMVIANYKFNRKFYTEWGKAKCLWEASRESIQLMLDLGGLIPVIGEVCDITNGVIYTIYGDGLNASLSYASAIPIAGWAATGAKLGVKVVNKTASDIASRQVLKWIVGTDGKIYFGVNTVTQARYQLRRVLMLTDGSKHAHHIIPVEVAQYAIVQKAAKSREAFHINEAINGIPLQNTAHLTGHSLYNDKVKDVLNFLNKDNPNVEVSYQRLISFNNYLRNLIKNNPSLNLGQIANLIKYP